jgi:hypothetical protein
MIVRLTLVGADGPEAPGHYWPCRPAAQQHYKDFPSAATVEVKAKEGRTASL